MGERKRLQYVDAIKGIAVIWIVFYHLLTLTPFKADIINPLMELFLILFFFFSGYFYRNQGPNTWERIWKRTKSCLIPFFVYSLIFWAIGTIYLVITNQAPFIETLGCLRNFYGGLIWNRDIQNLFQWDYYHLGKRYPFLADFWFLLALFFSSTIFFLLAKFVFKKIPLSLISILVLFALTGICVGFKFSLPYNLHMVPFWTAFMVLGAFIGKHKLIELPALKRAPKYIIGGVLFAIGVVIALLKTASLNLYRGSFGGDHEVISMLLCLAATIPFIMGIGMLLHQGEQDGLRLNEIGWVGSHSLIFYLFHMFYAWLISIIFNFSLFAVDAWWLGLILALSAILICIIHGLIQDLILKKITDHKKKKEALKESKSQV